MNKSRIRILDIFMAIILVVGIGIFSYPFVEDSLNDFLAQQMIIHYQKQASNKNSEEIKKTAGKNDKEKPTVGRAKRITRDRQFQPSS